MSEKINSELGGEGGEKGGRERERERERERDDVSSVSYTLLPTTVSTLIQFIKPTV